ncbi:hypothetical protein QQ045_032524 [Rhodiola kirilowii]
METKMGHSQQYAIFETSAFLMLFTLVSAQDPASAGLLCISECVTCPIICSPPPSPIQPSLPLPSPPPPLPALPRPPKCSPPPPPLTPPPPRFIYSFGGIPPPPRVYYGVFPAPPNEKGRPKGYEYPYPYYYYYSSGVISSCSSLYQLVTVVFLHMFFMSKVL